MAEKVQNANELRRLSGDELKARAGELKQTLFDLESKHMTGVLDSTADIQKTKREIARVLTVAREAELGLSREAKAKGAKAGKA